MAKTIRKELQIPQPQEQVWAALTNSATLAEWMFPNDFEPRVGHQFTFKVPPNPRLGEKGLTVHCEVLECDSPKRLAFSWSVGGPVVNTRVSYQLEPAGTGTHLVFEHSGFDVTLEYGVQAFHGAEFGWARMHKALVAMLDKTDASDGTDVAARVAARTERVFAASPRDIFAAFERPERLAQWWGPKDFTNTFEMFEFKPAGRWVYTMHGPARANYPNESVFREIEPDRKIVIEHLVKPWYKLTIILTPQGDQTHLSWVQEFESPKIAVRMRPLVALPNEQNLDRLQALLARERA